MARVDYDRMAASYEPGRGMEWEALRHWRERLARELPPRSGLPVVDIGSGTGQFARAFADWFGAATIGIEPSVGMRREARERRSSPLVQYVGGLAGHLPLGAASCGAAWLSTVVHHIPDLGEAARDVRRVLARGGPVLIRSGFPGATDLSRMFSFFPASEAVFATFPTMEETVAVFEAAGFAFASFEAIPEETAPSLEAYRARVARRADTLLSLIPDEAFAAGLARLDEAIADQRVDEPVISALHLLVMR